ncbi:MAG: redoxin family protein [Flavisolibacter sp.]|nr:redoxin family protein [Flavisolibacter sp.]
MKKKTQACVKANLCTVTKKKSIATIALCLFLSTVYAQDNNGYDLRNVDSPVYIGDNIKKSMPLGHFINYKAPIANLSDFDGKLVIFGFWFTRCGSCIAEFPRELALQKKMSKDIQIIMVTYETEAAVKKFINSWEQKNKTQFTLPIIVEDTVLKKSFRSLFNPYYVWLDPSGCLVGQTTHLFITQSTVDALIQSSRKEKAILNTASKSTTIR